MGSMTRREWIRLGAAIAVTAGVRGMAQSPVAPGSSAVDGAGSLRAHAEARGLLVGCAVNVGLLRQEGYRKTLAEQFNLVVAENCMKWSSLRPTATTYDFTQADALVAFAGQHGMKIRGHNLCWHEQLPSWFAATANKQNARQLLTDHIATVAGRYKGKIQSWDVLNEAVWIKDGRPDGLRSSSPWFELLGPEYIEIAFRAARQADPQARLTYNDYGIEYDKPEEEQKRAAVLGLLQRLQAAKVPLDAVGIQSHLKTGDLAKLGDGIGDFVGQVGKMGLEVYLTELDVTDDALGDVSVPEQEKAVAEVYRSYLHTMLERPEVKEVLVWGLADQQSWLQGAKFRTRHPNRAPQPLLFAESGGGAYRAKGAFMAMRDAMDEAKRR